MKIKGEKVIEKKKRFHDGGRGRGYNDDYYKGGSVGDDNDDIDDGYGSDYEDDGVGCDGEHDENGDGGGRCDTHHHDYRDSDTDRYLHKFDLQKENAVASMEI